MLHIESFLVEKTKIDKYENAVCNLNYNKSYVIPILNLKQALNHGWNLEKVHRMIKFNKLALLNPYIDMNNELAKNVWKKKMQRMILRKIFTS